MRRSAVCGGIIATLSLEVTEEHFDHHYAPGMDRERVAGIVRAVRYSVRQADPVGLGSDAPRDEYDSVSLKASAVLIRGGSVEEAVDEVEGILRNEWGTPMTIRRKRRLAKKLRWVAKRYP